MEVLEQPELATGEVDRAIAPHDPPRHEVHLQIGDFQPEHVRRAAAAQQRADPREQLGKRERLHEVVVRAEIKSEDAILDAVASGEDQHRCVDGPLAQRLKNVEAAATWKHQIQNHQIEPFSVGAEKPSSPVAAATTS